MVFACWEYKSPTPPTKKKLIYQMFASSLFISVWTSQLCTILMLWEEGCIYPMNEILLQQSPPPKKKKQETKLVIVSKHVMFLISWKLVLSNNIIAL